MKGAALSAIALLLGASAFLGPWDPVDASISSATTTSAPVRARNDAGAPDLPRVTVDVPAIAPAGRTVHVPAGGNLQAAIDDARGGDAISLEPGAIYHGPFHLPQKDGGRWIVIASTALHLLDSGRHVVPADGRKMPRLVSSSGPVFLADPGAHHYRLAGLEIAPADGVALNTLVQLGDGARTTAALPHHLIIDRCYLHGDPVEGTRRGISLNAASVAVVDSYLSDFKARAADAQAIAGWNGPGPFRIAGNYLEASGENVMFGGGDPSISGLVPADIEVVRNHLAKPLRWRKQDPSFDGTEWAIKNLFELKNARRVLIDGNLFEYNWPHAQNGFAILFTVRNQDGGAPWSVVEDVTFSNNVVRHVAAGINVLGHDDNHPSQQTRRIAIRNNVFLDVGGAWGNGRLFQLLDGTSGVTVVHNTAFQTGSILFGGDHAPHAGFVFRDNVVPHNEYGMTASGTGPGTQTLDRFFPRADVRGNLILGAKAAAYPKGNAFPASWSDIGVSGRSGAELAEHLHVRGRYARAGTNRSQPGADIQAVIKACGPLAPKIGS